MVQKFIKFIQKSPYKKLFQKIVEDIAHDRLEGYDIKPLVGQEGLFRLRKGSVRFVFKKTATGNRVIEINNRGDIY